MLITPTDHMLSLEGAIWIDVNTLVTMNTLPDRLADAESIYGGSLVNLFNCPIGGRGRIFEPTYGTLMYQFLQEPIDNVTAQSIRTNFIKAIDRWEPRIRLIMTDTWCKPVPTLPGYHIRISWVIDSSGEEGSQEFVLTNGAQ